MSEKKKEDKISIEGEKVNEIIKKAKAKGKMTYGELASELNDADRKSVV